MTLEEIKKLIDLKQEGSYWDFKKQWYDNSKKSDLLHDILCMSNNLENKDGLIIIGIDEENDYDVVDVSDDKNRKNTQKLVDFLKGKNFAGDIRPTVNVETYNIDGKYIDVIVIKNDNHTPYYLKDSFNDLQSNNIYTRIQDTNTPKNSSADIDKVEFLWKKRFGLLTTPMEKLELFITHPEDWSNSPYGECQKFHKLYPEYTISYDLPEDGRNGYEFYLFSQYDPTPHWRDIIIKYHQTILLDIGGASLDGGRYFTPCPSLDILNLNQGFGSDVYFKYMDKDSFLYKLNEFFYMHEFTDGARISRENLFSVVLLFENKDERIEFKKYAERNWNKRDEYMKQILSKQIEDIEGYKKGVFKEKYDNALILKAMLDEFREFKNG